MLTPRLRTVLTTVLVGFQAAYFNAGETSRSQQRVALGLTAITLVVALWPGDPGWRRRSLWLAAGLAALNLLVDAANADPLRPLVMFRTTILVGYLCLGAVALIAVARRDGLLNALLTGLTSILLLVAGNMAIGRMPYEGRTGRVTWYKGTVPHPTLGHYYLPNSVARTLYPDNPRNYFEPLEDARRHWRLELHDRGSWAALELPAGRPGELDVRISRAEQPVVWHIQLNNTGLAVDSAESYRLSFRARADAPRTAVASLSMAHPPWKGLGLGREVRLDTAWARFDTVFHPTASDKNARVHFDLGGNAASVQLADIELVRVATGDHVESSTPIEYAVSYRFNDMGCRGRQYPRERTAGTQRILVLGDSYALGIGVREPDTFAARLESMLNTAPESPGAPLKTEVINCSVPGYGTREERLFYQLFASRYKPDVVILVAGWNDDRRWDDDVPERPWVPAPVHPMLERSQTFLGPVPYPDPEQPGDFSGVVREIGRLRTATERTNTRLALVVFQTDSKPQWNALARALGSGSVADSIPVLQLGPVMLSVGEPSLVVHPKYGTHPNEVAHRIAADAIMPFLARNGLLTTRSGVADSVAVRSSRP